MLRGWGDPDMVSGDVRHARLAADVRVPTTTEQHLSRELLVVALLTLLVFFTVHQTVQNFQVDGHSMDPSFHNSEFIVVNKAAYGFGGVLPLGSPQRGDVVVFHYPLDPSQLFIKRVIGLPGDRIEIDHGVVSINGRPLSEPYIAQAPDYQWPSADPAGSITVPPGSLFVLGDNRNDSQDSHIFGFLPEARVVGRAWAVFWPPTRWGLVPSPNY